MSRAGTSQTLRRAFFFIGIPGLAACLTFILLYSFVRVRYVPAAASSSSVVTPPAEMLPIVADVPAVPAIGAPVRLVIPAINLDTTIKPAGLTSDGDMAIDDTIDDVAWYQLGYKPGEKGSAVIAGHYGWKAGVAAIFNEIHTLAAGDKISVYDQAAVQKTFVVREIRKYDPTADATAVFRSTDGKAHLNLVTCGGVWVNAADSYSDRLVVFADLE